MLTSFLSLRVLWSCGHLIKQCEAHTLATLVLNPIHYFLVLESVYLCGVRFV